MSEGCWEFDQSQHEEQEGAQAEGRTGDEEGGQVGEDHAVATWGQGHGTEDVVGGVDLLWLAIYRRSPAGIGAVCEEQPGGGRRGGFYRYPVALVANYASGAIGRSGGL